MKKIINRRAAGILAAALLVVFCAGCVDLVGTGFETQEGIMVRVEFIVQDSGITEGRLDQVGLLVTADKTLAEEYENKDNWFGGAPTLIADFFRYAEQDGFIRVPGDLSRFTFDNTTRVGSVAINVSGLQAGQVYYAIPYMEGWLNELFAFNETSANYSPYDNAAGGLNPNLPNDPGEPNMYMTGKAFSFLYQEYEIPTAEYMGVRYGLGELKEAYLEGKSLGVKVLNGKGIAQKFTQSLSGTRGSLCLHLAGEEDGSLWADKESLEQLLKMGIRMIELSTPGGQRQVDMHNALGCINTIGERHGLILKGSDSFQAEVPADKAYVRVEREGKATKYVVTKLLNSLEY
jgi:hypothetical protein